MAKRGKQLKINVAYSGDVIVIKMVNNFNFDDLDDFTTLLNSFIDRVPNGKFLFDLYEMPYITSAIIGKFVSFIKRIMEQGANVKFCNLRPQVKNIFVVTGLVELFEIYDSIEAAIRRY